MTNLTDKFETLENQLFTQSEAIKLLVDDVEGKLDGIYTLLDTINNNNATNTKYLLDALGGIDPCANCDSGPLIVAPPTTNPFFPGEASCKRAQAFVSFMDSVTSVLDIVSGLGTGTFPSLITKAYTEVIESSSMYGGVPLISYTEGVQLVGVLINYSISNIGRADTLNAQFNTLKSAIQSATFNSTSADSAKAAYASVINGSALPSDEKMVLLGAAYDGLFTFFFDPASDPDLTGFSGTACGAVDTICAISTGNKNDPDGTHNATWAGTDVMAAIVAGSSDQVFDQAFGDFTFECVTCTPGQVLAVSFVPGVGSVVTYPLPALVLADPSRHVYVRDAVADCVISVCISPPEA